MNIFKPIRCNCGHPACKHWHVAPVADQHGVSFTEEEANAVADLLNKMHKEKEKETV